MFFLDDGTKGVLGFDYKTKSIGVVKCARKSKNI